MASILLDTTVVIDLLRGRTGAIERLRALRSAGDHPCVSAISVEETVRGIREGEGPPTERLFAGFEVVAVDREQGWRAGGWRRVQAERGVTLTQADCLIAASAAAVGGRLATGNPRHFPIDEVSVEHWPVGE